jgi:hypothetical protein
VVDVGVGDRAALALGLEAPGRDDPVVEGLRQLEAGLQLEVLVLWLANVLLDEAGRIYRLGDHLGPYVTAVDRLEKAAIHALELEREPTGGKATGTWHGCAGRDPPQ